MQHRWEALSLDEREKFPPLAPDFVLELMPPSDVLMEAQAKLEEYIGCGVHLAWLINRKLRQVWTYRPGTAPTLLDNPMLIDPSALQILSIAR